jgi:hypothetical protein
MLTDLGLELATGPGNPPAVRFQTAKTVQFRTKPVQKCYLLHLARAKPGPVHINRLVLRGMASAGQFQSLGPVFRH